MATRLSNLSACCLQSERAAMTSARNFSKRPRPMLVSSRTGSDRSQWPLREKPSVRCAKSRGKWIDFIFYMSGFHASLNQGRPKCILKCVI
jgi:hypothetical protein